MGESRLTEGVMSGALFREIHKNSWLKRLPPDNKRSTVVTKRADRVWIVFCVHDDSEAFLEGYSNSKIAASHSPDWFVCLNNALHISPSICPKQNEYEFVITLNNEIIRLTAPSWESMHDWVEVLRSKLREMRILSPNENMYSRMPEIKPILLPTRDPTSPLPAPPPVPAILVPGVEPISFSNHIQSLPEHDNYSDNVFTYDDFALQNFTSEASSIQENKSETIGSTSINLVSNESALQPVISIDVDADPNIINTENKCDIFDNNDTTNVTILDTTVSFSAGCNSIVTIDSINNSDIDFKANDLRDKLQSRESDSHQSNKNITSLFVTNSVKKNGYENCENGYAIKLKKTINASNNVECNENINNVQNTENSNITIIQVSNTRPLNTQNSFSLNSNATSDLLQNQLVLLENPGRSIDNTENETQNSTVLDKTEINIQSPSQVISREEKYSNKLKVSQMNHSIKENGTKCLVRNVNHEHYEKIFLPSTSNSVTNVPVNINTRIPPKSPKFSLLSKQQRSVSHSELHVNRDRIHSNNQSPLIENVIVTNNIETPISLDNQSIPSTSAKRDEISAGTPVKHILMRGMTELQIKTRPRIMQNNAQSSSRPHCNPVRTTQLNGEKRRRSLSSSETSRNDLLDRNDEVSNTSIRPCVVDNSAGKNARKLTLREQQVLQLRQEMNHPGGVRLTLRKKDCLGSIALVDAFGIVWIAGWKQKQHPMLYNALHIGDHLMSVAGFPIKNASDVAKAMRGFVGQYVEFIVRRVPFGRVYAIRKETDGQCLGIIQDSNTATIVDIVPNSLAARHGIPPRAQTCDGLSLTSWVLTEINGRPLNLFFKDNEVRDRLNAVGRDISILIQPLDLIKQLKKQLKSLRGYKDYIVQ